MHSIENKQSQESGTKVLAVKHVVQAQTVMEGAGVQVRRAFPTRQIDYFDPFLLLDEMGPTNFRPNAAKGFPDHPHKGFETVTYLLAGGMRHRDSAGNSGVLRPGDVQWMTAGSGIVHSEMPDPEFAKTGGLMHGFQLWVNLPRKDKLVPPRYQDLAAEKVPVGESADGLVKVKVIAGEALGVVAPIETHTEIMYLHFTLAPGATFVQPVPSAYNTMAYVVSGAVTFGASDLSRVRKATSGQLVIFDRLDEDGQNADGSTAVAFTAPANESLELLLIGGRPLSEPVARYGPFVMNTKEEIMEAVQQYQDGKLGEISAGH